MNPHENLYDVAAFVDGDADVGVGVDVVVASYEFVGKVSAALRAELLGDGGRRLDVGEVREWPQEVILHLRLELRLRVRGYAQRLGERGDLRALRRGHAAICPGQEVRRL